MRKYLLLISILLSIVKLYGQENMSFVEGKISYITLQNIYVKVEQSGFVQPGDTIFIRKDQKLVPLFIAESVSSTSCVGKLKEQSDLKILDVVYLRKKITDKPQKVNSNPNVPTILTRKPEDIAKSSDKDNSLNSTSELVREQKIRGRLSASSYSSFSNSSTLNQRMRYTFSLSADHISGSKFSTDSYIMFTHKLKHWNDVQDNIFNALKIYSLSVNYELSEKTHFTLGRKFNPHLASVGAIDGLQAETALKNFTMGIVVGANPDYSDYSFNPKLFEYGAYLSYDIKNKSGNLINTIAFLNQTNKGNTDRRFAYFQHNNSLLKNLNLFASCEVDLFSLQNGVPTNSTSLTSLYLSIRYRFSRKLSTFLSYDARKNVIYYETFKNYLDQMLEDATRQGYQFRINYNPGKQIYSGLSGGYRFRKNDINPMYNANGFLTFNQVPILKTSVTFSTNWMKSSYVDGMIYGIRMYRDLIPSKLSTGVSYRLVDYNYLNTSSKSLQHMAEIEFSWRFSKKLSLSANYDGTFEKSNQYNSIYINLIKRF